VCKYVICDLGALLSWDVSTFSDEEFIDLHEPYLAKLVLVEVYLHLHQVVTVDVLEVKANDVAHF